jgi:hypothetical protein
LFFGEKGEKRPSTHVGISTRWLGYLALYHVRAIAYMADNVQAVEHLNNSHLALADIFDFKGSQRSPVVIFRRE